MQFSPSKHALTAFSELYLGVPTYVLHITSSNITIENGSGNAYVTWSNTLTIQDYIQISLRLNPKGADVIIGTRGEIFVNEYVCPTTANYYCDRMDSSGKPFVQTGASTTLTDVKLTASSDDFVKDIWILGDSMTALNAHGARWPYYPLCVWNYDTFLLQGLSGGTSSDLWNDLKKSLALGKPKILVWMLGANDDDASYEVYLDTVVDYCAEHNIELVLSMLPDLYGMSTASKKSSSIKNTYMLTKNLRYVDMRKAVSSSTTQVIGDYTVNIWYGDDYSLETPPEGSYIGSDRVHPTELGAKAEAVQILADVPEITNN